MKKIANFAHIYPKQEQNMANSIIRSKKSTSARQRKLMADHAIDEMDMAFCDLVSMGWDEKLAAYYAYSLTNDNDTAIGTFVRNQKLHHPGILSYMKHNDETRSRAMRDMQKKAMEMQYDEYGSMTEEYDLRTKSGMIDYLIDLSSNPRLDIKTRSDLAKQLTDLQQFKKEDIREEDNRINFYLPLTCKYCGLYAEYIKRQKEAQKCLPGGEVTEDADTEE